MLYTTLFRLHRYYLWQTKQNENFNKIKSLQYNAALAVAGAIRESSKEILHQILDFEYLSSRRWLMMVNVFSMFQQVNQFYETRNK